MAKKQPLISVVVPVYNVEQYLRRCLDSLVNQTYSALEIILVDDGAKDNSPVICDEYAAKDPRVKVIHKENGGVSSARNRGIDEATGEWVSFVDADDFVHLTFFEELVKEAENAVQIVACGYERFTEDEDKTEVKSKDFTVYRKPFWEVMQGGEKEKYIVCARIFKRELLSNFRFRGGIKYGEDALFNRRLAAENPDVGFCYIDLPLYFYYARSDSAVTKLSHKDFEAALEAYCEYFSEKNERCKAKDFYAVTVLKTLFAYRYVATYTEDKGVSLFSR